MRNWLLLPAWACVGLLVYACNDDDTPVAVDGGTDAPTSTATTPPPVDASISDANAPDTFVPDAGPQPGPVTVLVLNASSSPMSGIDVYFNELGGTIVKVTTGANGQAVHSMLGGGSITSVVPVTVIQQVDLSITTQYLTSVLDVQPADVITITPQPSSSGGPTTFVGDVSGTITGAPALDAGGYYYELDFGGCTANTGVNQGEGAPNFDDNYAANCVDSTGKVNFLGVALDQATNMPIAYAPRSLAMPDGGAITSNIAAADWLAIAQKNATYTGTIPTGYLFDTQIGALLGSQEFVEVYQEGEIAPASLAYNPLVPTFAPTVSSLTFLQAYGESETYETGHSVRGPSATTTIAENLATYLPRIHNMAAGGTALSPTMTWQQDAPLGVSTVASATFTATHTPDGGGTATNVSWQVVFAAGSATTSVAFPTLSPELAAIVSPDSGWQVMSVANVYAPTLPYSLARQYPAPFIDPSVTTIVPQVPAFDAKYTLVQFGNPG